MGNVTETDAAIISDAELDIPWVKKQVKDIGYKVLSYESKPYEKRSQPYVKGGKRR